MTNEYGNSNSKFSKKLGTQCQCDGNCRCGKIVKGKLDCSNCGWSGPESYNALTGKFVCPGCKTENCNSNNNNQMNNQMNNQANLTESSFSQGVVGLGMGNDGFLLWNNNPLGTDPSENSESNFNQETVAYAIGNQGMSLNPFNPSSSESNFTQETVAYAIGEQGMSLNPFSENPMGSNESSYNVDLTNFAIGEQGMALNPFGNVQDNPESNFNLYPQESSADGKLFGFLSSVHPALIVMRDVYCGKYCKSLGYMKSDDKTAFKKCKNSCKINYPNARKGKWKYPEAPAGAEANLSPDELAKQSAQTVNSMPPQAVNAINAQDMADSQSLKKGSNTTMYILIGVIAVILIIGTILLIRKNKA